MTDLPRFFVAKTPVPRTILALDADEAHHLRHVLRLGVGDAVTLIDGRGTVARATVEATTKAGAAVSVESVETSPRRSQLVVAFGVPKAPAMEFLVRRLTEVGVARLVPLVTKRSIQEANRERWLRIVREAAKQCQDPWLPELAEAVPLGEWLQSLRPDETLFIADEERRAAADTSNLTGTVAVVLGPEGGWTDDERRALADRNARPLGLGPNRLRTETASLVAAVRLKERLGEYPTETVDHSSR